MITATLASAIIKIMFGADLIKRRPETFAFPGFTHYYGWTRDGRFVVKRKTQSKRLTAKLKSLRTEARRRMHVAVSAQHHWLCQVMRGHYQYYGLPTNFRYLKAFYQQVRRIWFHALQRRNQRRMSWDAYGAVLQLFPLPTPRITHPGVARGLLRGHFRKEPDARKPHVRICKGKAEWLSYSTTFSLPHDFPVDILETML